MIFPSSDWDDILMIAMIFLWLQWYSVLPSAERRAVRSANWRKEHKVEETLHDDHDDDRDYDDHDDVYDDHDHDNTVKYKNYEKLVKSQ